MVEKHNRASELRQLLVVAWETVGQVKPDAVSPLLNTINRFSKDLYELENPSASWLGRTSVTLTQPRLENRNRRCSVPIVGGGGVRSGGAGVL